MNGARLLVAAAIVPIALGPSRAHAWAPSTDIPAEAVGSLNSYVADSGGNVTSLDDLRDSKTASDRARVTLTAADGSVDATADLAGVLDASGSATVNPPLRGGGGMEARGIASLRDIITVDVPATVTLQGHVSAAASFLDGDPDDNGASLPGAGVTIQFFNDRCPENGEDKNVCGGFEQAVPSAASRSQSSASDDFDFSVDVPLPAGTTIFAADLILDVGAVAGPRALAGDSAHASAHVTFALKVPPGVNLTTGSGLLPIVGAAPPNTPTGTGVTVAPVDPATGKTDVTLTFDDVTTAGFTAVATGSDAPSIPDGFALGSPARFYLIETTATYSGSITVCIDDSGLTLAGPPRLLHYENGFWVDTTIGVAGTEVCGVVTSLSPFAIASAVDTTPPTILCGESDGQWHATDVVIACTAQDTGSGLANPADASFLLATHVPSGVETANAASDRRTICDKANNCAVAGPVIGNRIDKKPPSIGIDAPRGSYLLHEAVESRFACVDAGSGIAKCDGAAAADTSSVGTKSFAVDAVDAAGNAAHASSSYEVTYGICLVEVLKAATAGSTIPIKLELCDAAGANVSVASVLPHVNGVDEGAASAPGNSQPGSDFRFSADGAYYQFNLKTTGLASGTHVLRFEVASDPEPHVVFFQVK